MTAEQFLSDLARQNLVPAEVVESLQRQVAKAAKPVAPQTLAKLLVEKGHLTAVQGQKLLGAAPAPSAAAPKKIAPAALEPLGSADDLSMGLAPLDDMESPLPEPAQPAAPAVKPAAKQAAPKPAAKAPAAKPQAAQPVEELQPLDELQPLGDMQPLDDLQPLDEAPPLGGLGGGDLLAASAAPDFAPGFLPVEGDPFAAPAGALGVAPAGAATMAAPAAAVPAAVPASAVIAAPAKKGSNVIGIVVGLVLVLAIAVGTAVAFFVIPRATGDEDFAAADQDYQAKQYATAIDRYSAALERYPRSPHAGAAKVHRAMARILTASTSATDWPRILPVAKEVLPPIAAEPELPQIHAELAPLLTDMADGLVSAAVKARGDEAAPLVALARDALDLTSDARLVPGSLRQWQRLASAEESLAVAEYEAQRSAALAAALAKIGSGPPDAAYAERSQLLLAYPDLAASPALRDAFQQVAQAEAARVTAVESKPAAVTTETHPAIVASLAFATPLSAAPANVAGRKFAAAAGGAIWAFDGPTGKLLWRRAGAGDAAAPVPVSADAESDLLIADAGGGGLLRVAAATGTLVWRLPLQSPLAGSPVVSGGQVFATTRGGQILKLDAASGETLSAVQLPQPCRVGPSLAANGSHVYQLADHSQLFALSASDLQCAGVLYIGHETASVVVPPLVVGQHLIVADNAGAADAMLHAVALQDDGMPQGVVQRLEVPGHVLTPPIVVGKNLIVLTDRGAQAALALSAERSTPLEQLGQPSGDAKEIVARYGMPLGSKLAVAGDGLRLESLDAANGSFQPSWSAFASETLLGPPQLAGDVLFCLRSDPAGSGAIAAAVQASTGKPLWQTQIAVPLAGALPGTAGEAVIAVTQQGRGAGVSPAERLQVHQFALPAADQPRIPLIASVLLPASAEPILVPAGQASQLLRLTSLETSATAPIVLPGVLAGPPILWSGGILSFCSSGDVQLLDPATGSPLASPLQVPLQPGHPLGDCSLAAAGESALLSDGQAIRLLSVEKSPQPHLAEQAVAKLATPTNSPVAALSRHAFVVASSGELQAFALRGLTPAQSWPLAAGSITAGPIRAGSKLLVATGAGELWCFDDEPKQLWKVPLAHGPLAGDPVAATGSLIVASKSGILDRLDENTGKVLASLDLGQSLAGTPVVQGQFVLVPAADGTLLKVNLPAEGGNP